MSDFAVHNVGFLHRYLLLSLNSFYTSSSWHVLTMIYTFAFELNVSTGEFALYKCSVAGRLKLNKNTLDSSLIFKTTKSYHVFVTGFHTNILSAAEILNFERSNHSHSLFEHRVMVLVFLSR